MKEYTIRREVTMTGHEDKTVWAESFEDAVEKVDENEVDPELVVIDDIYEITDVQLAPL